jgi:phage terminase large subunit GpA-like protein
VDLRTEEKIERLIAAFCDGLQPPPVLTVSEWADRHRMLSPEAGKKGKWRTLPYQKEPLDVLSPSHPCQIAVYKTASQVLKTELLLNALGYTMHLDPGPTLFVEPREKDAKDLSKDRVGPMIRDMPVLKSKITENTLLHIAYVGGHVTFAGAISPSGLAMRPIRYLFLDEVDRYNVSAGKEGNPISLALRRTDRFRLDKKVAIASSPTYPGSNIDLWYERSDQRKYHVPCPLCGGFQVLYFKRLEWPEGEPQEAQYRCSHCQELIPHFRKAWMVGQGKWIADNPQSNIPGFWLSKLVALIGPTWGDIAEEFLEAQKNPESLKAFFNTVLAESYEEKHETKVDEQVLLNRCEAFGPDISEEIAAVTCGVDVQGNRLEVEFVGWGRDEESWSIAHKVLPGNPEKPDVWKDLDEVLATRFRNEAGVELPVRATCIDSSDNTTAVYRYTRERMSRKIYAVKGREGHRPIWPKKISRGKNNNPVFIIGVDVAKDTIYERLKLEIKGPGYCHFPLDRDLEYFEQLTAERKFVRYRNGFRSFQWKKAPGDRNEALDIRVYAYAALHSLYSTSAFNLNREAERMARLCDVKRGEVAAAEVRPGAPIPKVNVPAPVGPTNLLMPRYSNDPYL